MDSPPTCYDCGRETPYLIKSYRESLLDELVSSTAKIVIRKLKGRDGYSFSVNENTASKIKLKLKFWMGKLPENYLLSLDPEHILSHLSVLRSFKSNGQMKVLIRKMVMWPSWQGNENTSPLSCYELSLIIACEKDYTYFIVQAMMIIRAEIVQMQSTKTSDEFYVYFLTIYAPFLKEEMTELELESYLHHCIMNCGMAEQHARAKLSASFQEPIDMQKSLVLDSGKSSDFGTHLSYSIPSPTTPHSVLKSKSCDSYFENDDRPFASCSTLVPGFDMGYDFSSLGSGSVPSQVYANCQTNASQDIGESFSEYSRCSPQIDDVRRTRSGNEDSWGLGEDMLFFPHLSSNQEPTTTYDELERIKRSQSVYDDSILEGHNAFSIAQEELNVMNVLGKSFRSLTYRAKYKGEMVALKVVCFLDTHNTDRCPELEKEAQKIISRTFTCEVESLKKLEHPNICKLLGTCLVEHQAGLVLEFLSGGDLCTFIRSGGEGHKLPLFKLLALMAQVADGMTFVHSKDFIHRDIKSSNLLIDKELWICKIADFGVCCHNEDEVSGETGTYRYMAPEVIQHHQYSTPVDVYSFGIVLWEIVVRKTPFEGLTPMQAAFGVAKQGLRPELPQDAPQDLCSLINRCWRDAPESRPTFAEVCRFLPTVMENL